MEKRISKVKQEDFVSFFTVDAIVFLRNQRARFQLEIRNEEKERNECWLRITFRGLSNPRKGETRSISFFYRSTTNARMDNFSEGRNSVLSRDAMSIRVCGWINIARGV